MARILSNHLLINLDDSLLILMVQKGAPMAGTTLSHF